MSIETINLEHNIRVVIEQDDNAESPASWGTLGEIAYLSRSRNTLGTRAVSEDRLDEISAGIRSGALIGLPVYAYVHSGVAISCGTALRDGTVVPGNPFGCPLDSGQSGFVYCSRERAIEEFGKKRLTKKVRDAAIKTLVSEVETFCQYLQGEVYGWIVERVIFDEDGKEIDTEELDSCWGCYGLDYAIEEGKNNAAHHVKKAGEELGEVAYWQQRDVVTTVAAPC